MILLFGITCLCGSTRRDKCEVANGARERTNVLLRALTDTHERKQLF